MEQLKYNLIKNLKNNIYQDNHSSKYKKNINTELNPYPKYLKQGNQINIKSLSDFNSNDPIISEIDSKNNDNVNKDKKPIVNYYSFPVGIKNSRANNMKKKNFMEQYSMKGNAQNNYYLNYLQNKRNTYDFQENDPNVKNLVYSDIRRINTSETNVNSIIKNKNIYKKYNNSISNDKLYNRLNSSKSSNNFLVEDDHDISIEYNNPPIINSKRNNYSIMYENANNGYEFKNSRLKNIKELSSDKNNKSIDNNNNYKEQFEKNINRISKKNNLTSVIYNEMNKSRDIFEKKFFDVNISNIDKDKNGYISEEKKYEYLIPEKKIYNNKNSNNKIKNDKNNIKNINNYDYNASWDLYQIKANKIFELNKNDNKMVQNNSRSKINTTDLSSIKKRNIETINQNISKRNVNNNKKEVNTKIRNASTHNNLKTNINNIKKNYNISNKSNRSNYKQEMKKYNSNKSKKDININKEYILKYASNRTQISKESITQNIKVNNFNKIQRPNNDSNSNMNINNINMKNSNDYHIYEVLEVKNYNNNNYKNRNLLQKKLLKQRERPFTNRQEKKNDTNKKDAYNSVDIHNNEISNKQSNINSKINDIKKSVDKIPKDIIDYYNYKDNLNFYESKYDTSRNNSKIEYPPQNLIFSAGHSTNSQKKNNNIRYKSTKNLKNDNRIMNVMNDKNDIYNSPQLLQMNNSKMNNIINNSNIINNNYKNIIIKFDEFNCNNDSKLHSNTKEEPRRIGYNKTEYNINHNNDFLKNEHKKYNNTNNNINQSNNEDSCSILKSINYNKPSNNNPVKLYSNRNNIEKNKINNYKDNSERIEIIHINNNFQNQLNFQNNKIKKYKSDAHYNNNRTNLQNIITPKNNTTNNIININNNNSNVNVLNVKNSAINIRIENKEKFNILSPEKNINLASSYGHKENSNTNYRNNKKNVKDVANELLEKNKNFKNLKILNSSINKNNRISNYLNPDNEPSLMKISTNTIRYNNNLILNINNTDNNVKSSNNIFAKNIIKEVNTSNNNDNKQLLLNNSEAILFNKKITSIDNSKTNIRNINTFKEYSNTNNGKILNNIMNNKIKDNINNNIQYKIRNYKSYNDTKNIMKIIKSPEIEKDNNLINYYKNMNIPLISPNNSIQINALNSNKNKHPEGIYIKPSCVLSLSKSKSSIVKSKSELKMCKSNNNKSNKNIFVTSLKKTKKNSKSLSSEIYFNTSPTFHQNDELSKSNKESNKREIAGSANTSIIIKNFSKNNINENEKNISNEIIKDNKRGPIVNNYCFFYKICNYFIKSPKIEVCYLLKNSIRKNNVSPMKNNFGKTSLIQEAFLYHINNVDEERNNESSQNGLIMTFGDANCNNKKIDKSNALINSISKANNFIGNITDNINEDSDLDIYKSLQQISANKVEKVSNNYTNSNIINSENEDLKIFESLEKDKNSNTNINRGLYKTTNGILIDDEEFIERKSLTFKKSSKYLKNAEKGLKILGKIASRRGIKIKDSNNNIDAHDNFNKKNENIFLGTNKLNELFNSRRETESSNIEPRSDDISNRNNKIKTSKSVNKEIMQGITKIENVLEKNSMNSFDINSIENKLSSYERNNKRNNTSNSKENMYNGYIDYSEILKSKKTYLTKSKTNLGSSNDNNTFDSYLDIINNNENEKYPKYRESEILVNKFKADLKNSKDSKDLNFPIKKNLLNEELFNHYSDLLSNSGEEIKTNRCENKINEYNIEEFERYLKDIKNKQSDNSIKHDLIYLLNILVDKNYSNILSQITKIILYKNNSNNKNMIKNNNYILNTNNNIIENEHLFKNIIFKKVAKESKYIFLYANLCNDLNNNISNSLSDQKNTKNNKDRNLKLIINDEFVSILNNFKNSKKIIINDKENIEYYILKQKIIAYITFIYELINLQLLKQQFGLYTLEQLYKLFNDNNLNNIIREIYLGAIILLLNKLGKLIFENNNQKLIQSINNYINNNLEIIINNNTNNVSNFYRYKIMNLITKRDNQWKDTLSDIKEKEEKEKYFPLNIEIKNNELKYKDNYANKIWNKEINIDDVNSSIIEEDLINYISYYTEENNKGQINIKNNIDKSYNWKIIDELINDQNFGLESIIKYFIKVCTNIVNDDNQIVISNDYIKNIIEYYASNLSKKSIDSIHNEMIKTFSNVDELINKNKNMYKILGNLLFILIDNKLYHIKYFNNYLKTEKQTQINLAIITKYCIISSGKFAKKYFNDFKQTKLFFNNEIFLQYVNEALKDLLYYIQ